MKSLSARAALLAVAALTALPALAARAQASPTSDGTGTDIVPVAVWTVVGVLIFGLVLGIFYLFKRRVGGFPRNPKWVAPITIMPAGENADEGDFGDQVPSAQAHAEH